MKKLEISKEAKELIFVLIVVIAIICISIIIFALGIDKNILPVHQRVPINKDSLRFEIIKALFQLLFVAVVGTYVTYLFRKKEEANKRKYERAEEDRKKEEARIEETKKIKYEKEEEMRKKEEARSEIRIDYLKRLGNIYSHIKEARRALRAGGLTSKYTPSGQIRIEGPLEGLYFEQINIINKYQLELENLKIEAMCLPAFIHMSQLEGYLGFMEDYLRKIITEYEEFWPRIKKKDAITLYNLTFLDEFTGKTHGTFDFAPYRSRDDRKDKADRNPFKKIFSDSYHDTIKEISDNLYLK